MLGLSLSTIVFYPNKVSKIFANNQLKVNKRVKNNLRINARYNETQADRLFDQVRILCWIITTPENHLKKALHIQKTWGTRCNKLLFMSSQEDVVLKTVALPVREGRSTLWDKTRSSLQYIYNYHLNDAEWFLKADDDA
jgi:glycoprotein-N-acetylgalactosamine 3-beta-galactosyltransferase